VTDHCDRTLAGRGPFVGRESPAHRGLHAEHVEIISGHHLYVHLLRLILRSQLPLDMYVRDHSRSDLIQLAHIHDIRPGKDRVNEMRIGALGRHHRQLLRVRHRQRPHHQFVDQAEDSRGRAYAQRDGQHCNHCESGFLQQRASAIAQILQQGVHGSSPFASLMNFQTTYLISISNCRAVRSRNFGRRLNSCPICRIAAITGFLSRR
jgi:hypothetical protein